MLSPDQIRHFHEQGYLHLPGVFSSAETAALQGDLDWMITDWATRSAGWDGPWRDHIMGKELSAKSELIHMHDLQLYAASWATAVAKAELCGALAQLLDGPVELHHTTMHIKPPETGHPFPMHQDYWFYPHHDARYVDALFHLDDTCHENGEIRFVPGSHRDGPLPHVREHRGAPCQPHLPAEEWPLADTVPVSAKAGDVVLFNINTVHGSYINTTGANRRLVRVGYRHPENHQLQGQSVGRPGWLVHGRRLRTAHQEAFSTAGPIGTPELLEA
ncbi:MAG: phytanoyl-CoA dioxygenase family protein [Planctomycetota bacterium]|jgi:phytanoyl-CoA hydroxylase|nr:phytanoyl-CoA dioxygenase family protein [Planctomycetota bacterium]